MGSSGLRLQRLPLVRGKGNEALIRMMEGWITFLLGFFTTLCRPLILSSSHVETFNG